MFVERLWRSIEYREAYLRAYVSGVSTDETENGSDQVVGREGHQGLFPVSTPETT